MKSREHWDDVHRRIAPAELSWHQREPTISLDLIRRVAPDLDEPIIDVGGGASTLVDGLLDAGYRNLTVLDLSDAALGVARERLGGRAESVKWLEADVRAAPLASSAYSVWHDRAVFHFLTDPRDRAAYVDSLRTAVRPGGHVIVRQLRARRADAVQRTAGGTLLLRVDVHRAWRDLQTARQRA